MQAVLSNTVMIVTFRTFIRNVLNNKLFRSQYNEIVQQKVLSLFAVAYLGGPWCDAPPLARP